MNKKILISTIDCWNAHNSATTANTFATLFDNYEKNNLASIYMREDVPTSNKCAKYYRISENLVIKSIFINNVQTGKVFEGNDIRPECSDEELIKKTQDRYRKYGKKRRRILLLAREILWKLGNWKSKELNSFLDEVKPDIIIFGMEGYIFFNRINRYIIKKTGAKGIGFFWDDNFTYNQHAKTVGFLLHRYLQKRSLKKTVQVCSAFFAISPKTKEEADKCFGISCDVLTKPINYQNREYTKKDITNPLKIVYTGNLQIGRIDTLVMLSDVLYEIENASDFFEVNIYSHTEIDEEVKNKLNPCVNLKGGISSEEVKYVQRNADVLLYIEDLVGDNKLTARLSFSTKLTDYLGEGKCILAIANNDIAPIEYFRKENVALCASTKKEIKESLIKIMKKPEVIDFYGERAYLCGKTNHSKEVIEKKLYNLLDKV